MRRALVWSVGGLYALAWFVPVIKDGDTLANGGVPGWQALLVSLSPLWGDFDGSWLQGTLCVCSGLTNLVILAALLRPARRWSLPLFAATALNTFWIIDLEKPANMRAGYWLWLASFALLGLVLRLSRAAPPAAA